MLRGGLAAGLAVVAFAVGSAIWVYSSGDRAEEAETWARDADEAAFAARDEDPREHRWAETALREQERLERAALTAYSPDGSILVTVSEAGNPLVWDTGSDTEIGVLETSGHVAFLSFSPDGRWIATCGNPLAQVWDARSARLVRSLEGHEGQVLKAAFHPRGGVLATAGEDRTVRLWDLETGHLLRLLRGCNAAAVGLAFSRDGRELHCLASDKTSRTWSSDSGTFDEETTTTKLALVHSATEEVLVSQAQKLLGSLRRYDGTVDGKRGPRTTRAVRSFQESRGLQVDGRVSKPLLAALHVAIAETEEPEVLAFDALPAEVEKGGSVTVSWEVLDADEVVLSGAGSRSSVPPSGSRSFQVEAPATYTLTARKGRLEVVRELEVRVREEAGHWYFRPEVSPQEGPVRRRDVLERVTRATVVLDFGGSSTTGFLVNAAGHVLTVLGPESPPRVRSGEVMVRLSRGDSPLAYRQLGESFGLERGPKLMAVLAPVPGTALPFDPAQPYWLPIGYLERDGSLVFDPEQQYRLYSPVSSRTAPPSVTQGLFPAVELLAPKRVITADWILRYRCHYCQDGWRGAPVFDAYGAVWGLHLGHQGGGVRLGIWIYPVLEQYRIWERAGLLKP